jgi:hypothetical protein
MIYTNMDKKSLNKKKIIINLFIGFIIILFILSIFYIYISNNSTNSNTRRKINEIQNDISNLYNYTETMGDFIIDNYKLPETQLDLKNDNDLLRKILNNTLKIQLDLKKENELIKNKLNNTYKIQLDLKKENELNKNRINNFLRTKALNYLKNIKGLYRENYGTYIHYIYHSKLVNDNYKKIMENINENYLKYFEELLNIDYDNLIVSFAYFNENPEINYNLNPIYKFIINETLIYNKNKINSMYQNTEHEIYLYNYKYIEIVSIYPQTFI